MPIVSLGPDYIDDEVHSLMRLLNRGGWMPSEVSMIDRAIQDRAEWVRAGLTTYTGRYWTEKIQREIDDRTRLRWDFKNGWTLDRWAEGRWQVAGVFGFNTIRPWLIQYLREHDMQDTSRWANPQEYLAYKRAKAQHIAMENEYRHTQKLLGIVDRMSDRQVREFVQVEKAMHTGETITMHGATLKSFERMRKASQRSPAPPSGRSINPGMHPFKYVRKSR